MEADVIMCSDPGGKNVECPTFNLKNKRKKVRILK